LTEHIPGFLIYAGLDTPHHKMLHLNFRRELLAQVKKDVKLYIPVPCKQFNRVISPLNHNSNTKIKR
jgi:hypothetical protein